MKVEHAPERGGRLSRVSYLASAPALTQSSAAEHTPALEKGVDGVGGEGKRANWARSISQLRSVHIHPPGAEPGHGRYAIGRRVSPV